MPRHIYIHVPFCARRCSYCDFSIAVRREVPVDEYLGALAAELRTRFGEPSRHDVDTLYFGGGTPSRLGGEGLARAVSLVSEYFRPGADAEVTAEANPEDVTVDAVRQWREAGINRLSLGAQTFDDRVLTWMHRTHDARATADAVRTAREGGITNLSLDLIFALPESLGRNFENDVRRLLILAPDHVSLYGLTVEPQTPLGKWVAGGLTTEQPEEGYESDFLLAHRLLTDAGLIHYEVSNYGLPGRRARHNSAYWSGVPYVGVGPAAHGFDGHIRRWNTRNYAEWQVQCAKGTDPLAGSERLTDDNKTAEEVYLGLRSDSGLTVMDRDEAVIERWEQEGWITRGAENRIRCSPTGWLRLDALAAALTHRRSR